MVLTIVAVAVSLAACGRASREQINQALGITPTPTLTADQIATATAAPSATTAARTALALSPGTPEVEVALLGDVRRGGTQFTVNCARCHRGSAARGGDLLAAGGPGADVTFESLLAIVRAGENHPTPPGPVPASRIDDADLQDLVAYIRSNAAP